MNSLQSDPFSPITKRSLPRQKERILITLLVGKLLDLKLEVYSILEHRTKNEIVIEALKSFLGECRSCDVAHSQNLPPSQKKRITFILTSEMAEKLDQFAGGHACNKTCIVNAALIVFLERHGVDTQSDPVGALRWALSSRRVEPPPAPVTWEEFFPPLAASV